MLTLSVCLLIGIVFVFIDRYCVSASPQNGTAYPMNDTESGVRTAVFFKCNAGYALVGPSTLPCENGTFSGKVPRCVGTVDDGITFQSL